MRRCKRRVVIISLSLAEVLVATGFAVLLGAPAVRVTSATESTAPQSQLHPLIGSTNPRPGSGLNSVNETLVVSNGTVVKGNYVPEPGCTRYADVGLVRSLNQLYVTCSGSKNLLVFNSTSDELEASLTLGTTPQAVLYDPSSQEVYVANNGSSNISIISARNISILGDVAAGSGPGALAIDAQAHYLFVADYSTGSILILSTVNWSTVRVVDLGLGTEPDAMTYDANDSKLFVAEAGNDSVMAIAVNNFSVIGSFRVNGQPTSIITNENGSVVDVGVYNATNNTNHVAMYNSNGLDAIGNVSVGFDPVAEAPAFGMNELLVATVVPSELYVINQTTGKVLESVVAGLDPSGIVVDPELSRAYVSDFLGADAWIVNLSNMRILAYLDTNSEPNQVAWDPIGGSIDISEIDGGSLVRVNATTGQIESTTVVAFGLGGVATDQSTGDVMAVCTSCGSVYRLNSTGQILGNVSVGIDPVGVVVNTATHESYVADSGGSILPGTSVYQAGGLTVVNDTGDSVITTVPTWPSNSTNGIGDDPVGVSYDQSSGMVIVAQYGCLCGGYPGYLESVNATTNSPTEFVLDWATPGPAYSLVDYGNGRLYVADSYSDAIWEFDASNLSFVSRIPLNSSPSELALDPASGDLFVTEPASDALEVISTSNNSILGSIQVGLDPGGVAFDPVTRTLYIANTDSGTVSIVNAPTIYSVSFSETGLVGGLSWGVEFGGSVQNSTGPDIQFAAVNGSYTYSIHSPGGWYQQTIPTTGLIAVDGSSIEEPRLSYYQSTYLVEFVESGLPVNSSWSVLLGAQINTSQQRFLSFTEPNGTYVYRIVGPAGWNLTSVPPSGNLSVNGRPIDVNLSFAKASFLVTFEEVGLTPGTTWSIDLNGTINHTSGPTNSFVVQNGTYAYSVSAYGRFMPVVGSGAVTVSGSDVDVSTLFAFSITLTFIVAGLPEGQFWNLSLNASDGFSFKANQSESSLPVAVPSNTTYLFSATFQDGYGGWDTNGNVTVSDENATVSIQVGAMHGTRSPVAWPWYAAGFGGGIAIAIGLAVLLRRCRGGPGNLRPPETPT